MNKEKILDKIKKCLALSKSANEHNAAQALKQAQALMEKYEVNAVDIALSEVSEQGADRRMAFKLANWQWGVANMLADIFGCQSYQRGKTMMFYGIGNRAEISAYAFDVVYRQISADRRKFLKTAEQESKRIELILPIDFARAGLRVLWGQSKNLRCPPKKKPLWTDT